MQNDVPKPSGFLGWKIVAAAFVVAAFGWGFGFYGPPVFLDAVMRQHGWPLGLVSAAVTTHFLAGVMVVANLARLYARWGLQAITAFGAVSLAIGVMGWAFAPTPPFLFVATLFSGAGWAALGPAAINAIIAPWFAKKRALALSSAYNGASIGGVLFSPLWLFAITSLGFPLTSLLLGGAMVATVLALVLFLLGRTPALEGQFVDGVPPDPAAHALHTQAAAPVVLRHSRCFLTLASAMAVALFAQIGLIAHLVSLLSPRLGPGGAGIVAGLATAAAVVGRMLVGWLSGPQSDWRRIAAINLAVQSVGVTLFGAADGHVPLIVTAVVLFGFGIGNGTSLPPLIAHAEFPPVQVQRVVSLIVAMSQAAYAFAPVTFGAIRAGVSDVAMVAAAVVLQAVAAAIYMTGRQRA